MGKKNKDKSLIERAGAEPVRNPAYPPAPPSGIAAPEPLNPQTEQFLRLNKLYRQTYETPMSKFKLKMGGGTGLEVLPWQEKKTNRVDLGQLMQDKRASQPRLRKLINFAGAQGYSTEDTQNALQTYLQQEQALSRFMPRHYRAPNKNDLLGAVNAYAPQYQQEREAQQQAQQLIPFMAMIRDSMLATADSDYAYMQEKAAQLKDPDKQAQAMQIADNMYRLKLMQADAIATNPMSSDPRSIASILGAANSGETRNINNLYGGASNVPDASSTGTQAIDENFIRQVLGE